MGWLCAVDDELSCTIDSDVGGDGGDVYVVDAVGVVVGDVGL